MLFTTPDLGNYISGAILYEETLFQNHADGTPFVDCLHKIGVIPGIKVDTGLSPLPGGHEVETWCSGLDGLVERAKKYYAQGARFAKWRAVLQITSDGAPSALSIQVCCGGWLCLCVASHWLFRMKSSYLALSARKKRGSLGALLEQGGKHAFLTGEQRMQPSAYVECGS